MDESLCEIRGHEVVDDSLLVQHLQALRPWWEQDIDRFACVLGVDTLPLLHYSALLTLQQNPHRDLALRLNELQKKLRTLDEWIHYTHGHKRAGAADMGALVTPWNSISGRVEVGLVAAGHEQYLHICAVRIAPETDDEVGYPQGSEHLDRQLCLWSTRAALALGKLRVGAAQ